MSDKVNFSIDELSDQTKAILKEAVLAMKVEKKDDSFLNSDLSRLEEKLQNLKDKYEQDLDDYNKHKISSQDFEKISKKYEYDSTELLLEITTRKKEIKEKNNLCQRLNCLLWLLAFPKDSNLIQVKGLDGSTKLAKLEDVYQSFLNTVLEGTKEKLKFNQDIIRLKLKFNKNKECLVDQRHKFYISRSDETKLTNELYSIGNQMHNVIKDSNFIHTLDYRTIKVGDFISPDSEYVYENIFRNSDIKKYGI